MSVTSGVPLPSLATPPLLVTLPSLVNLPSHRLATCRFCSSTRVTTLSMTLTDGTPVEFTSCHRCEGKRWSQGRRSLALASVLDMTRKQI